MLTIQQSKKKKKLPSEVLQSFLNLKAYSSYILKLKTGTKFYNFSKVRKKCNIQERHNI